MSSKVLDINRQRLPRDSQSISERVALFAKARCEGHTVVDSYALAGYSRDHTEAYRFHRTHKAEINSLMSEELSSYVPQAISTLVKIMKNENERGAVRLKAAQDILDRAGFGSVQKLDVTTSTSELSTEDLNKQIALLMGNTYDHWKGAPVMTTDSKMSDAVKTLKEATDKPGGALTRANYD